MMGLEGKRILFFAPAFFGYENKIAEKMEQLGAIVDLYDERSVTKAYEKALLKISPKIFTLKTKKYYEKIIDESRGKKYDYVFVIKCEMMPIDVIRKLKKLNPDAKFCLYLYDSIKNIKGILRKIKEFDRVLSFDLNDVKQYPYIIFRPLFYLDCYQHQTEKNASYKYDICFVGTVHSDRYAIIKQIKNIAQQRGLNYYFHCYLQSKFIYNYYKITKKEFRDATKDDFSFQKICSSEIVDIIKNTKIVLDIQHPKQTGLTMRTIEMLGMNKKLITTNFNIKEYDFYDPNNILIIDRKNISIPESFLLTTYKKIKEDVYKRYSLESWIYDVLGC